MTKQRFLGFACLILLLPVGSIAGQIVFGVKPGFGVPSSYIGISIGPLTPQFGFDIVSMGAQYETEIETEYGGQLIDVKVKLDGSARLLIPHAGIKFYIGDTQVRPYFLADLFKAFASVDLETRLSAQGGSQKYEWKGKEKEFLEDLLGVWGFIAAFGGEYFFSDRFSVGGEFGLRLYRSSAEYKGSEEGDLGLNGDDEWLGKWDQELAATLKITYGTLSLNYRF